jgi:hypothetical protein
VERDSGERGVVAWVADAAEDLAARSLAMREAIRTPMPSLRPKRFGSMGEVYRERGIRE